MVSWHHCLRLHNSENSTLNFTVNSLWWYFWLVGCANENTLGLQHLLLCRAIPYSVDYIQRNWFLTFFKIVKIVLVLCFSPGFSIDKIDRFHSLQIVK